MSRKLRHALILRGLLAEREMSYQDLADELGCAKSTVSQWGSGRRVHIGDDLADRLLEALKVDSRELFTPAESPTGRHNDTGQGTAA